MKDIKSDLILHIFKPTCLALFLIVLFVSKTHAQVAISGLLNSTKGEPLENINILATTKVNTSGILSFGISDVNGNFKLLLTDSLNTDSILLVFRSLNYQSKTIKISYQSQFLKVALISDTIRLKAINVNSYPMTENGDTLNYQIKSFAKATDHSVADVIKRMPGFEIKENGEILYRGNPIQNYYIEGMNLLDKRYPLANKNLSYQSVQSVEVLQNYQPIKMLQGKIPSNKTSINLKLKKNIAVTGSMYAGIGGAPLLYALNLSPMLFQAQQQLIASWQMNNTGDDLSLQHQPVEFKNGELESISEKKLNLVGVSELNQPQITKNLFLKNHADLGSYNQLFKLNSETQFKINSSYYHDHILETGTNRNTYYLTDDTILVDEQNRIDFYKQSLLTNFTLSQNGKDHYFTNKLSINLFKDNDNNRIQKETNQIEHAETPYFYGSNKFDLSLPVHNNFIRFYSYIQYTNAPQHMTFNPGIFQDQLNNGNSYETTRQNYTQQGITSNHFAEFSLIPISQWIIATKIGINFEDQQLNTSIDKNKERIASDSLQNKMKWIYTNSYISETLTYKNDLIQLSVKIPINYQHYRINDKIHENPNRLNKWLLTPKVSLNYKLNNNWDLTTRIALNHTIGQINQLTKGYIFKSYRNLYRRDSPLSNDKSYHYYLGTKYKNIFNGFFAEFYWLHTNTKKNLLNKQTVSTSGIITNNYIEQANTNMINQLALSASQYCNQLKTNIKINTFYNTSQKDYWLNEQLGRLKAKILRIEPKLSIDGIRNLNIGYSYLFQLSRQSAQTITRIREQKQQTDFSYSLGKCHLFALSSEFYQTSQTGQERQKNLFLNFAYYLHPKRGKIKYKAEFRNLFNQSSVRHFYTSDISSAYESFSIRPRQVLVTVSVGL